MSDIVVSIPARPEFVHVLRSVIASIAALRNFSYDAIDDLRIAVDEACAHLLTIRGSASALVLRITPTDGRLEIVATSDANIADWPPAGAEQTLTWQVLSALADEARFERDDGRPAIRFTRRAEVAG